MWTDASIRRFEAASLFDGQLVLRKWLAESVLTPNGLEQLLRRFLQDLITEETPAHWERRAATLEWCRPRPGDFTGQATAADLAELDARLALQAEECRNHAAILRLDLYGLDEMAR